MSANFTITHEVQSVLDEAVEVEDSLFENKKTIYIKLANALIASGMEKKLVSREGKNLLEERLYEIKYKDSEILRDEVKLNAAHWYTVMRGIGCTDPAFARHTKLDTVSVSNNSSIKEFPEGIEFEILSLYNVISKNNQTINSNIFAKLTFDEGMILKTKSYNVDTDRRNRLTNAKNLIESRRVIAIEQIQKFYKDKDLKEVKKELQKIVSDQEKTSIYFDDRATLTHWEKIMGYVAVQLGYDQNNIAKILGVTAKHMKINICSKFASFELLKKLRWVQRCPNPDCGIELHEFLESKMNDFKNGKSINTDVFEIESLVVTGYQAENLRLVEEISKLKVSNKKLKAKLTS